jgi:hypothetical protein
MEPDLNHRLTSGPGLPGVEAPAPGSPPREAPPLRSVHASNFSATLQELGISVLVTTYQAGKPVMPRPDGERFNTHFRGFGCVDPATGEYEALTVLPGFTSGLDPCDPPAERCCGVWVVNTHTGQTVAYVKFEDAVRESVAVQVLPGVRHPDVINDQPRLIADSFVVPDEALDLVPGPLRHPAGVP